MTSLYDYVGGDPVNWIDPDELQNTSIDGFDSWSDNSPDLFEAIEHFSVVVSACTLNPSTGAAFSQGVKGLFNNKKSFIPDSYWENQKFLSQITPGTRTINRTKPGKNGKAYHQTGHYDEYGRNMGRTDRSNHGYSKDHPNPHHHRVEPTGADGSGKTPVNHLINPDTGNRIWPGLFGN